MKLIVNGNKFDSRRAKRIINRSMKLVNKMRKEYAQFNGEIPAIALYRTHKKAFSNHPRQYLRIGS